MPRRGARAGDASGFRVVVRASSDLQGTAMAPRKQHAPDTDRRVARRPRTTSATSGRGHRGRGQQARGRRFCALRQDQELPLAHGGPAFSRLPSDARRAIRPDFRHHRSAGRTGAQARQAHPPLDRPDQRSSRGSRTTTRISSRRSTCCGSSARQQVTWRPDMREAHEICDEHEDVATASLLESLHRRNRTADLVPVRGVTRRRRYRSLTQPQRRIGRGLPRLPARAVPWRAALARRRSDGRPNVC